MRINWRVRLKNKYFWVSIVSAVFAFLSAVLPLFGVTADLNRAQEIIMTLLTVIFTVLAAVGVVVDPTTQGLGDSVRALGYEEPAPNGKWQEMEAEVEAFLEEEAGTNG